MSAIPELRYEARCADLEEFVVAYQGFVEEGTLVLPTHPHLKIGGECRFTIVLRMGGRVVLGGRCSGLELLSDGQGFRHGSKAVRVRVLEIDPAFGAVHDRLVTRSRCDGGGGDPRLGRLQNLLRVTALPPAAPAPTFDEPTAPEEVPAPPPARPALQLRPPLARPRPAPVPLTVRKAAAAPRTPPVPHPLLPVVELEGPAPAPAPAPAVAAPAPAGAPPLVAPTSSSARLALWWISRRVDPLRGGLAAALRRGAPMVRAGWAAARGGLGRHRKVVIAGLLGFALGLAVRGGPRPRPAAASPELPVPATPAQEPRAILDSRAPVGTLTPVEIGDPAPAPEASITTTSATVTPSPPALRHRRRTARHRHLRL